MRGRSVGTGTLFQRTIYSLENLAAIDLQIAIPKPQHTKPATLELGVAPAIVRLIVCMLLPSSLTISLAS
jgi:hypothetical protein